MCFCTIVTPDYISYALALRDSLRQFNTGVKLYILVAGPGNGLAKEIESRYFGTNVIFYEALCGEGIGKDIYDKYYHSFIDGFRWSMKPVLVNFLIKEKSEQKVIYVDCDVRFYSDYKFLFDELDSHNVLLTPHWRSPEGTIDEFNYMQLYVYGLYNAGFIAVSSAATHIMEWWARANLFICMIDTCKGQFVDQTHLNLLPVYFDGVKSLKHRGCNLADWNQLECRRIKRPDGSVYINDEYPVVFIHFTFSTMLAILENRDPLLLPHLKLYYQALKDYGVDLEDKMRQDMESRAHRTEKQKMQKLKGRSLYFRFKSKVKKMLDNILKL